MRLLARPAYHIGAITLVVGAGWLHAVRLAPEPYRFIGSPASWWWLVFIVVHLAVAYGLGLPELATSRTGAALKGLGAVVAAFAVIATFQTLLATPLLPRSSSTIVGLVLPVWTLISWHLSRDARSWAATRDRVFLVLESEEDEGGVEIDVAGRPESPCSVVGSLLLDQIRRAGPDPILERQVLDSGATIVVLDVASQADHGVVDQAAALHGRGIRIRTLSMFYEHWIGKLPHGELARVSLLFDVGQLHRIGYVRAKRILDVAFALVGLLALIPVVSLVALVNARWNRGPLLFRQDRVGRNGQVFEMLKLRTMTPGGGGPGSWTENADRRITPFGRLLRRSHLDELPQVVNILKGDLSLVGPRPEQPHYVDELGDKIAFYDLRHIVRPGLTGWAQIKQGYAADHDDAFEKLQYDFYYLRRQGLALDAKIIWRTVREVIAGDGR